ncbi:MAG: hypothetical protein HZA52_13065 [Planctomycetes bacterium]|nr:hypothetical protein [Planctomycetota bacterium]
MNAEWAGVAGGFLLVAAYARRAQLTLNATVALNVAGALLLGVSCVDKQAFAAATLQVVWIGIAIRDRFARRGDSASTAESDATHFN